MKQLPEWRTSIDTTTVPASITSFVAADVASKGFFEIPQVFLDTTPDGETSTADFVELVMKCSQNMSAFSQRIPNGNIESPPGEGWCQITLPWRPEINFFGCVVCYDIQALHSAVAGVSGIDKQKQIGHFRNAIAYLESILVSNIYDLELHSTCGMHKTAVSKRKSVCGGDQAPGGVLDSLNLFNTRTSELFTQMTSFLTTNVLPCQRSLEELERTMKTVVSQQETILASIEQIKRKMGV